MSGAAFRLARSCAPLLVWCAATLWASSVRAQDVEVCSVPGLDATRLMEVLRIEVGAVDATFRIDACTEQQARVTVVRGGRTLVRVVPWGDTPRPLRVRLVAIVLAELLHTDEAIREFTQDASERPRSTHTPSTSHSAPPAPASDERVAPAPGPPQAAGQPFEERFPLVLVAHVGLRIFPPLPLAFADDDLVTLDAGLGLVWRRLVVRANVVAGNRSEVAGQVKLRAYLGMLGGRLLDSAEGRWRFQLDVLGALGTVQARGHFDPNPADGGRRQRIAGGAFLGLGMAHDHVRSQVGFRCELGYLRGMVVDQGGRRTATLDGWNVAFYLALGFGLGRDVSRSGAPGEVLHSSPRALP